MVGTRDVFMINNYSFGKICIHGIWYSSDLKIIDGAVLPDWWRKTGHVCSREDIEDILRNEPEVIILGKGKPGMMKVDSKLRRLCEDRGITLIVQPTVQAVATFNSLYTRKRVGAGFHLTC